jgi:hypothetical protein
LDPSVEIVKLSLFLSLMTLGLQIRACMAKEKGSPRGGTKQLKTLFLLRP